MRFCFILVDLSGFILRHQTVLCAMAVRPRATFAHTKTVRLIVEDGMEITALEIVRSLPVLKKLLALSRILEVNVSTLLCDPLMQQHAWLHPVSIMGPNESRSSSWERKLSMSLSVFVALEFPDQEIVNFLKQYGQLKSVNLRRLCYNEEALETSSVAYTWLNLLH